MDASLLCGFRLRCQTEWHIAMASGRAMEREGGSDCVHSGCAASQPHRLLLALATMAAKILAFCH